MMHRAIETFMHIISRIPNLDSSLIGASLPLLYELPKTEIGKRLASSLYLTSIGIEDTDTIIVCLFFDYDAKSIDPKIKNYTEIKNALHRVSSLRSDIQGLMVLNEKINSKADTENAVYLILSSIQSTLSLFVFLCMIRYDIASLSYSETAGERDKKLSVSCLNVYSPIAARLGATTLHDSIQEFAFQNLYPDIYDSICKRLFFIKSKYQTKTKGIINSISEIMKDNNIISEVSGRQKSPYSIWSKMQKKAITINQMSDVLGFRIITKKIDDCYKALGLVHRRYKNIDTKFKDYISKPKANLYQSIHTVVIDNSNMAMEIQIRTEEMHEVAQFGVAAHWLYKSSTLRDFADPEFIGCLNQEQFCATTLDKASDIREIVAATSKKFNKKVVCFTKDGDLISLPKGSNIIDFAFAIHSELGPRCIGAKVNDVIVDNYTLLKNGDQITIISGENCAISLEWLSSVKSKKAYRYIRNYLKNVKAINLIGQKERFNFISNFRKSINPPLYHNTTNAYSIILQHLHDNNKLSKKIQNSVIKWMETENKKVNKYGKDTNACFADGALDEISMGSASDMRTVISSCCLPVPGDKIISSIKKELIFVHREDCRFIASQKKSNKFFNMKWEGSGHTPYVTKVYLILSNVISSVSSLFSLLEEKRVFAKGFLINEKNENFFSITLSIEIKGKKHLENLIDSLQKIKEVRHVSREIFYTRLSRPHT